MNYGSLQPVQSQACSVITFMQLGLWRHLDLNWPMSIRQHEILLQYLLLLLFSLQNHNIRKNLRCPAFIEFRIAYDLVDHNTVTRKIITHGLPSHLITWLDDFITNDTKPYPIREARPRYYPSSRACIKGLSCSFLVSLCSSTMRCSTPLTTGNILITSQRGRHRQH